MKEEKKHLVFYEAQGPTPGRITGKGFGRALGTITTGRRPAIEVEPESSELLDLDTCYVHRENGEREIRQRPEMELKFSTTKIKVGQVAVMENVPSPCQVIIKASGRLVANQVVLDGTLEVEGVIPTIYEIELDCWPYFPKTYVVEVIP